MRTNGPADPDRREPGPKEDGGPTQGEPAKRKRRRRRRRKPSAAQPTVGRGTKGSAPGEARSSAASKGSAKARSKGSSKTTGKGSGARASKRRKPARPRGPKIPTQREVSAGGVVYRRADDGIEVVLASRRTRKGQLAWGLAKGGIEEGETKEIAAIREVREETGLTAEIEADLGDTKYMYVWEDVRIRKTVHFFLMRFTGGDVDDRDDEMEEIRWFPLERAIKRAAYRGERDILAKARDLLV